MRVLITGNLGYVGPSVMAQLRESFPEAELVGFDAGFFASQSDGLAPAPEIVLDRQFYGDVRDLGPEHLDGIDALVHLAAVSNDPMGDRFAEVTEDVNQLQSIRIAQLAKQSGVGAFVFASSASVYGAGADGARSETSEVAPQTAYARSKIGTEEGLAPLADDSFTVTCLRFSTACGWSPRVRLDLVLNDFVASALTAGCITVLSDGSPWRPLIHVRDMARAIDWALSPDRNTAPSYVVTNVGCEEWNFQIRDLANAVGAVLGDVEVSINTDAPADKRSYRVDFTKWRELAPNHQPTQTLDSAIAELAANFRTLPDLDENFRQSTRIRLHRLNELKDAGLMGDDLRWTQELYA